MGFKIGLIGAGQLGSRYLQGLTATAIDLEIEVVEPFAASAQTAKERYAQMPENPRIASLTFFDSIAQLSETLDLVIVATAADVRFNILDELLRTKTVRNLLLEKVLFQCLSEYDEAKTLLDKHNVKTWVNHPRRLYPFYAELKSKLSKASQISYSYQGGNWGLGCNALHFIDHLSFLCRSNRLSLQTDLLNDTLYPSKRPGFYEFNGTLTGTLGDHSFALTSLETSTPGVLTIVSDVLCCTIDEANGYIRIAEQHNNWRWEERHEKIVHFQTEVTAPTVEAILLSGGTALPTYDQAMVLHTIFIQALLEKMGQIDGQKHILCPIT